MDLFIGNATKKLFVFTYWLSSAKSVRTQQVPIGGQIKVSGDLNQKEIDAIIAHHARYGLISVDEIDNARNFSGYCYSVGKPIPSEKLTRLMGTNQRALILAGAQTRRNAAIAAAKGMDAELTEKGIPERLTSVEATFQEETAPADGGEQMAEGIRVDLTNTDGNPGEVKEGKVLAPRGRRSK